MTIKRIKTFIGFTLAKLPMSGHVRFKLYQFGGINFDDINSYIGEDVHFDTICPENIHIGKNVHITVGVTILTHYLMADCPGVQWRYGHVYIGDYTFIGANATICKDVRIGKNCIIGAGSVVTKDIPDGEIWAGNPARFIRKRG